jgi:hypothetical protein
MAADTPLHNSPLQAVPDTTPPPPPRWSAVQAAREAGVSRSTIHDALKSGRLQATKDDHGQWRITPQALIDAGFRTGKPTKSPHQAAPSAGAGDDAPVPAEVARLRVEVLQVQLDGERRLREVVERQLVDVVHERDVLRRQLEAAPTAAPSASQPPEQPQPDPMPHPVSAEPPRANVGKWGRAWNIIRHG